MTDECVGRGTGPVDREGLSQGPVRLCGAVSEALESAERGRGAVGLGVRRIEKLPEFVGKLENQALGGESSCRSRSPTTGARYCARSVRGRRA